MITAAVLRKMFAMGLTPDQVVELAEALEEAAPRTPTSEASPEPYLTIRQARNKRYYESKARAKNSDGVQEIKTLSDAVKTLSDDFKTLSDDFKTPKEALAKEDPQTPKENSTPETPPSPPKGGSSPVVGVVDLDEARKARQAKDDPPAPCLEDEDQTRPAQAHGTRLPKNWTLPPDLWAYAAQRGYPGPEIEEMAEDFRLFWQAKAGANARKVDWAKTWMTWVRNQDRRGPYRGRASQPSRAEQAIAGRHKNFERAFAGAGLVPQDD
jgi:hypothetical protein